MEASYGITGSTSPRRSTVRGVRLLRDPGGCTVLAVVTAEAATGADRGSRVPEFRAARVRTGYARLIRFRIGQHERAWAHDVMAVGFAGGFLEPLEPTSIHLILHYHSTLREEPLWQHCRRVAMPDSLLYKVEQFTRTGRLMSSADELFREASWCPVLVGQN